MLKRRWTSIAVFILPIRSFYAYLDSLTPMSKRSILFTLISFLCIVFNSIAQDPAYIDSLKKELKVCKTDTFRLHLLSELCWETGFNYPKEALVYGNQALELAAKTGNTAALAQCNSDIGAVLARNSQYSKAIDYYQKSLELFNKLGNSAKAAGIYNNISINEKELGHYEAAIKNGLLSLSLYERLQNNTMAIWVSCTLVGIFEKLNNFKKALEFSQNGEKLLQKLKDKELASAQVYTSYLLAYGGLRQYDRAIEYGQKALAIFEQTEDYLDIANLSFSIGVTCVDAGKYQKAIAYYDKALKLYEKIDNQHGIADVNKSFARLFNLKKQPEQAKYYALKALSIAQRNNYRETLKYIYSYLSDAYEAQGNYSTSLKYQILFSAIQDTLYQLESTRQIAEMQTRYETEKKETENKLLARDNEIKGLEISKKTTQLSLAGGLLLLILLFLFLSYNRYRIKSRLKELEAQQKIHEERERISRDLHDNVGSQLTFALMRLNEKASKKTDPETASIALTVKDTINQLRETIWTLKKDEVSLQEFELRIRKYLQQLFKDDSRMTCKLDSRLSNNTLLISPANSLNIFRIVQEALQNIMKHSEATEVTLHLDSTAEHLLSIRIQDNGKGFDPEQVKTESYGLIHMKERSAEINAQFTIHSEIGKGCSLNLSIPISS